VYNTNTQRYCPEKTPRTKNGKTKNVTKTQPKNTAKEPKTNNAITTNYTKIIQKSHKNPCNKENTKTPL
jgi:hypothetical protein